MKKVLTADRKKSLPNDGKIILPRAVEGLEKLLPILSGLKYIKHKNRVQQLIESYRIRIKEEEISDILNG